MDANNNKTFIEDYIAALRMHSRRDPHNGRSWSSLSLLWLSSSVTRTVAADY